MSLANNNNNINNLRISQESINMDDIISELNPINSVPSQGLVAPPTALLTTDHKAPKQPFSATISSDLEMPHSRSQHQKIAPPSEKSSAIVKNARSPKKGQGTGAAHQNGKKIAMNNVKSSGYG